MQTNLDADNSGARRVVHQGARRLKRYATIAVIIGLGDE
jgi:hypothetical protein